MNNNILFFTNDVRNYIKELYHNKNLSTTAISYTFYKELCQFINFIKKLVGYNIKTAINLIKTDIIHKVAIILCIYIILSCDILKNITHILFLVIGKNTVDKFKVIHTPSLAIISNLSFGKNEYINNPIHHAKYIEINIILP